MDIEEYRAKIDEIDGQIVDLIVERAEIVKELWEYKRSAGIPVISAEREKVVLDDIRSLARSHGLDGTAAVSAMMHIMNMVSVSDGDLELISVEDCVRYWESELSPGTRVIGLVEKTLTRRTIAHLRSYQLLVEDKQGELLTG